MSINFRKPFLLRKLAVASMALTTAISSYALSDSGEITPEDINDMALIWIGNHARSEWNKELFTPYVMHTFRDGHKTWLFDGFLMLEGQLQELDNGKLVQTFSLGESHDFPARKEHWEYILDKQLGLIDGTGCKALDETIGELIPVLGKPATKHKVVMMQCIPSGFGANWGTINGKLIDFGKNEDKIEAMKWYTDLVIEKFAQCNFKNIVLDGIYWLRESIDDYEIPLVKGMTPYYREKGLKSYWVPWLRAGCYDRWKEMGFDMVYEQPGYFFSTDRPKERLTQACEDAWAYDFGIELEFEGNFVVGYDENRQVVPQSNSALYEHSPIYHQRFIDYIDALEEYEIFTFKQMAYYCGYQAVYDFAKSTHPKDKEVMDRLASILEKRHITSGWYVADNAGCIEIEAGDHITVSSSKGSIDIRSPHPVEACVFSTDGIKIFDGNGDTSYTVGCHPGIYIVKAGSHTVKIAVM